MATLQGAYLRCAGLEGAPSRGTRGIRRRPTRDVGLAPIRLSHMLTLVKLNQGAAARHVVYFDTAHNHTQSHGGRRRRRSPERDA